MDAENTESSNNNDVRKRPVDEEKINQESSFVIAYALWFFVGWLGIHRFYLGKWFSGIIYFCSFGLFFFGWAIDIFLIPSMIRNRRKKLHEEQEDIPEEFIPEEAEIAPWAKKKDFLFYIEFPLRALFFIFTPALFVCVAILMNKYELVVLLIVILFASSSIGLVHKLLQRNPSIERIPALKDALQTFKGLHKYYFENKPRSFIFYLCYFFVGFPMMLISPSVRQEFKLYTRIVVGIFIILLVETIFSYSSTYPPHLGISDAILLVFVEMFLLGIFIVSFMMPTVTTSFSMSLRGNKVSLYVLTILSFLICIPMGIVTFQNTRDTFSMIDEQLIQARLQKESFCAELTTASEMFLEYHIKRVNEKALTIKEEIQEEEQLTDKYHRHIGGLMTEKEVNLFLIVTLNYRMSENERKMTMYGVLYYNRDKSKLLYVIDDQQKLYEWDNLPEQMRQKIVEFANKWYTQKTSR